MEGETVLCMSPRRWDSLWKNIQQIMSRVAVQNRVIFFEMGRDPNKTLLSEFNRKLPNFFKMQIREVHENVLAVETPSTLPHARQLLPSSVLRVTMPIIANINTQILIRHVRRAMRVLQVRYPILWLYNPGQVSLIGKFGEKFACYYNYDEFANFKQNSRISSLIRHLDSELCRQVDVVFATSRTQWEHRRALNSNTYFMPNGVDFELFNRALNPETSIPLDVASLKTPVIGLVGWLSRQIDLDLLLAIAEVYSDCSIVLVGPDAMPMNDKHRRLRAMSNVHFLGRKQMGDLPGYLKAMDVALIPYLLEGYVLTAYPLKLHEYLAAGRAVVSTALPELRPYSRVVRIAETRAEFVSQIREALSDRGPQAVDARVAVARENTWDNRVSDIYSVLRPLLSGRGRLDRDDIGADSSLG